MWGKQRLQEYPHPTPPPTDSAAVEQVSSTKLLGVTWTNTISLAKKAQLSLYFLHNANSSEHELRLPSCTPSTKAPIAA